MVWDETELDRMGSAGIGWDVIGLYVTGWDWKGQDVIR